MEDTVLCTLTVAHERDLLLARQRARQVAELLGFDQLDQGRISTALSEIVRNTLQYAGGGEVRFGLTEGVVPTLVVTVSDHGPGIPQLQAVLDGRFVSRTGIGLGINGARRLSDSFSITSDPGRGTVVTLGKRLPPRSAPLEPAGLARMIPAFSTGEPELAQELETQDKELLRSLDQLRRRQLEIERLNRELEETNRGVVALYSELDEHAGDLARAAELKSRVLSDISHEVRTPLNAILNVTRLLLDRIDGELTSEQEHQIVLIRNSAGTMIELVNDLLEMARMEAGKTVARISEFSPSDLFATLRGMFRPLITNTSVNLVLEDVSGLPGMQTDEGKVSQIMRNLISNALKFTERGEVRVSARLVEDDCLAFSVCDTGIGIAPEDQELIFAEFAQIDNAIQRQVLGTGLGLPLSRKLAEFLGGTLTVQSQPGQGSTFTATLPRTYSERCQSGHAAEERRASKAVEAHHA